MRQRSWVLVAAVLGSGMVFLDGTVVNVVLPSLQANLHATAVGVEWVVEAYALFLAALLLVGGALGDRFGRRRVFTVGLLIFAGASAWCGASPNMPSLITARAVQGIGGALLTPGSLALITASFPEDERGRAIGTWSGASGVTAALGPVVGGWLIDHVSFRWAFFLNLPLAALAFVITRGRVPESRNEAQHGRLDVLGAMLITLALFGVVFGLLESSTLGFGSAVILGSLAAGVALLIAFAVVESRREHAMLPLRLFRSRAFSGANVLTFLLYGALGGAFFFLPLDLIQVQGYSAAGAGAALLPFVVVLFLLSRWAGGLVERYGSRGPLVVGPAVAGAGFALLAVPGVGGSYVTTFFPGVLVLGCGMAVTIAPLTTTVMNALDGGHAGLASGVNNAVSRAAGLLAVAVLGIVFVRAFEHALAGALASMDVAPALRRAVYAQRIKLAAIELPASTPAEVRDALEHTIREAFVSGHRLVMGLAAGLALLSAGSAAVLMRSKKPDRRSAQPT